jgi:hypothetical protein
MSYYYENNLKILNNYFFQFHNIWNRPLNNQRKLCKLYYHIFYLLMLKTSHRHAQLFQTKLRKTISVQIKVCPNPFSQIFKEFPKKIFHMCSLRPLSSWHTFLAQRLNYVTYLSLICWIFLECLMFRRSFPHAPSTCMLRNAAYWPQYNVK